MPRMTVCSSPGCPEITPVGVGKCEEHIGPAWINPSAHTRDRPRDWWRRRARVLRRDNETCQRCGGSGKQVDHIIPVSKGGSWSTENLQTLCGACHSAKTRMERRNR